MNKSTEAESAFITLLQLFPDCDPDYLRHCISFYNDGCIVEHVTDKIIAQHGEYPRLPPNTTPSSANLLNVYLDRLAIDLFPEADITFLRKELTTAKHSHLYHVVDSVLERDRKDSNGYPRRLTPGSVERWQKFKSTSYQKECLAQLLCDFPKFRKSTIKAVLAETNYDYISAHKKLLKLPIGWLAETLSYFSFLSSPSTTITIQCSELVKDIEELKRMELEDQSIEDHQYARMLNNKTYEEEGQLIMCGCCFSEYAFEDMTQCTEGHLFCKTCIRRLVEEGLYGQMVTLREQRLKCIEGDGCNGYFCNAELKTVLKPDIYKAYVNSAFEDYAKLAEAEIVRCSFCSYYEYYTQLNIFPRLKTTQAMSLLSCLSLFLFSPLLIAAMAILIVIFFALLVFMNPHLSFKAEFNSICTRLRRKNAGKAFQCRNPECGRLSCLNCHQLCRPLHKCFEKEQDGMRLYIENAMTEALTRICPKCNVSFQKTDGCNKMTCRCGYVMCYVCRQNIGTEKYQHFCQHFQPIPGVPCKSCNKCNLYRTEDDEVVVKRAAKHAREEYLRAHPTVHNVEFGKEHPIGPPFQANIAEDMRRMFDFVFEMAIEYLFDFDTSL